MHQLEFDRVRNRLNLRVSGRVDAPEMAQVKAEVKKALATHSAGYVAAIDLRGMGVLSADLTVALGEVQAELMKGRPSKIGTLVDSSILEMQINRVGKDVEISSLARRFGSEAEWRAYVG